jgi:integrase/recombinase XerC/integrase/recombinase XerD
MNEIAIRQEAPVSLSENLQSLIDGFLLSQDIKQTSKKTYEKGFKRFKAWIIEKRIARARPTREDILAFKGYLEAQGLSSFTLSTYLVAVRKFFEWAEGMKYYPNIARGVKGAKKAKGFKKDPLTVDQVKDLLKNIDRSTLQGKRDHTLLTLLIRTGLRTVEVIRAEVGDIRQEGGEAP